MNRPELPLQPSYNISIRGHKGQVVPITPNTTDVTYDERADMIRMLSFRIIANADYFIKVLSFGTAISFSGGYLNDYRRIFDGTVTKIRSSYNQNGDLNLVVEAMSTTWQKLGKNMAKNIVYPSKPSSVEQEFKKKLTATSFANSKDVLTVKEIVEGICLENNVICEVDDTFGTKQVYSLKSALYQNKISDWTLLQKLAKNAGCTIWTEFINDVETLFFKDKTSVRTQKKGKIKFFYASRNSDGMGFKRSEYTADSEWVQLHEVSIDEDISSAHSISYGGSKMNFETGEEESFLAENVTLENGQKAIRYYKLNEQKVSDLEQNDPAAAKALRDMGAFNIPWEIAKNYYDAIDIVDDEDTAMYDAAFYGITITASCDGNLDIRSQRSYEIYNISRYGSSKGFELYWLYSMKHTWNSEGFLTQLEFRR